MLLSFLKYTAVAVVLLTSSSLAGAADWTIRPTVEQEIFYDSNITLGPVIEEEVEAYKLAPRANIRGQGGNWSADFDIGLTFTRLSNQLYDSDDQVAGLELRRFSERQSFDLTAELRRESPTGAEVARRPVVATSAHAAKSPGLSPPLDASAVAFCTCARPCS